MYCGSCFWSRSPEPRDWLLFDRKKFPLVQLVVHPQWPGARLAPYPSMIGPQIMRCCDAPAAREYRQWAAPVSLPMLSHSHSLAHRALNYSCSSFFAALENHHGTGEHHQTDHQIQPRAGSQRAGRCGAARILGRIVAHGIGVHRLLIQQHVCASREITGCNVTERPKEAR